MCNTLDTTKRGRVIAHVGDKLLETQEYDIPELEREAVLMRVQMANICGSDIHIWRNEHPLRGIVMGHEMMGTVEKLGAGVTTDYANQPIKEGDRICPVYWWTCHRCSNCMRGEFNSCQNAYIFKKDPAGTYPYFIGGYGTFYYIHHNQHFYKLPDSVSNQVAAGLNCGIAQMYFSVDKANVRDYETVVFQGSGGLGLFGTASAKEKGARVIVIDKVKERLQEALDWGADHVIDMNDLDTVEKRAKEIKRLTNGDGADVVFEVTGVANAFEEGLEYVRSGGRYIIIGNVSLDEDHTATIVPGKIVRNHITVEGHLRYQPWYLYKTIKFVEKTQHKYPFDKLADRVFKLSEVQEALELSEQGKVKRAVINCQEY
ncbi:MAG TPA: zinc-binding dehydrogenase [Clostridiaceae bacterium]|nr:zinc-binding dehydrogenase [Clostridiaceae bacterium]